MATYLKNIKLGNVISFFVLWIGINLILIRSFLLDASYYTDISIFLTSSFGSALFFVGAFFLFKNWSLKERKEAVYSNFKAILFPMALYIMVVVPGVIFWYGFDVISPEWTPLYLFFAAVGIVIYLLNQLFVYYNLILNQDRNFYKKVFRGFTWFLLLGVLFLFMPRELERWLYFPYLTIGLITILFLATRQSWVGYIKSQNKWQLIVLLLCINIVNFSIFIVYTIEFDSFFFEIGQYPFPSFFLLLLFSGLSSLVSLGSMLFFIPISGTLDKKINEIDRLIKIGNLGRNESQDIQLYQYLLKAAVEDTNAKSGWFNFNANQENLIEAKNISISDLEKIESRLYYRLDKSIWKEKYFELTADSHPFIFDKELESDYSLVSFNYNIDYKEVGRLYLIKTAGNSFKMDHIHLVRSYLKQARLSYQSRLLVEKQVEAKRVEEEFRQAKKIQQKLLPQNFSVHDALDFDAFLLPSRVLSGDFYDFFKLDDNRVLFIMGDIAGKGLTASLYMAELKGIFQTLATFDLPPKEYIFRINEVIKSCFEPKVFVTLTYLMVNFNEETFTYARAGQCPLLYYDHEKQEARYFKDEGMGLGILKGERFKDRIRIYKHSYKKGDTILLFSDGISEATNVDNAAFGLESVKEALEEAPKEKSKQVNEYIYQKLKRHTLRNSQLDDLTSLVIRFK